ncbi:DUF6397 family protein [Streptomyces sp. NPDC096176]|uniref:DUF6397 family protein n=1 Tax=Streptomyces sp. NPDC096176 TaxID=3366079 RepID=UPI0037FA507F
MAVRNAARRGLALGRAAQELGLRRGELDLALQLGEVGSPPEASGGPPRIDRQEIDRLHGEPGFPATLRKRLRTVGTAEGAELAAISQGRFLRLARTGHFAPVRFYVNRYHAVVWLYLAEEVADFAREHAELLTGVTPPRIRAALEAGEDRRPRNWRGRRLGRLLHVTSDPWHRAAAIAAVLDPVTTADVVPDPYERSHLRVLRPDLAPVLPKSPAGREIVERLLLADHPDEILWHGVSLVDALREAREHSPAPRPEPKPRPRITRPPSPTVSSGPDPVRRAPGPAAPGRSRGVPRGLLGRLWRRKAGRA